MHMETFDTIWITQQDAIEGKQMLNLLHTYDTHWLILNSEENNVEITVDHIKQNMSHNFMLFQRGKCHTWMYEQQYMLQHIWSNRSALVSITNTSVASCVWFRHISKTWVEWRKFTAELWRLPEVL